MLSPSKKKLRRTPGEWWSTSPLHPEPRLYKHYWQLFTLDSPWEGDTFFDQAPVLCTAACFARLAQLKAAGQSCIVYGYKRPRRFPGMPFDPNHEKWRQVEWAPALEDDPDPEWNGFR